MRYILSLFGLIICLILVVNYGLPFTANGDKVDNGLRISEVMVSNANSLRAHDYESYDWLEIHNYGKESIQLSGYGLSDDGKEPFKWTFPNLIINPGEYILIWASGLDTITEGEIHTNFAIKAGEEAVVLTHPDSTMLSAAAPETAPVNYSYGFSLEEEQFVWYPFPTPGYKNSRYFLDKANRDTVIESPKFSVAPGFYEGEITLGLEVEDGATILYTLDGTSPDSDSTVYFGPIKIDGESNPNNNINRLKSSLREIKESLEMVFENSPKALTRGAVVRAVAYREGEGISKPVTANYIIDEAVFNRFDLPVMALVTDSNNFFDYEEGIYVSGKIRDALNDPDASSTDPANYNQRGMDWERPVNVTLFSEKGDLLFNRDLGVRIFGGWTRSYEQKSLRLYARDIYGNERLEYPLFDELLTDDGQGQISSFKRFLLRSSGNDSRYTLIRDALMQSLIKDAPLVRNLASQAYKPVVVFINGEYWGIHNLRESLDQYSLGNSYGIDPDDISIVEFDNTVMENIVVAGDEASAQDYTKIVAFAASHDLSEDANYEHMNEHIDVADFATYTAAETFYGNIDWPGNNARYWRKEVNNIDLAADYGQDGRWRFLLYDLDFGFHLKKESMNDVFFNSLAFASEVNGPQRPNPPLSTLLFRRMLENDTFVNLFVTTYSNLLNTSLSASYMQQQIRVYAKAIENEMDDHKVRYRYMEDWDGEIQRLYEFAEKRTDVMWSLLQKEYNLGETVKVSLAVNDIEKGTIQLGDMYPTQWSNPFVGSYFENVPISMTAIPKDGYTFRGWNGIDAAASTINVYPSEISGITAIFE